ncbi:MAG TPA: ATP-binding protein, partial [Gemmataceae bacterium]|nr:ATP-binding protein [Gemmataceae bacterium]
ETPDAPLWVQGDPTRLAQVMDNLLSNAVKFTPAGGTLTVSAAAEAGGRQAVVRVRDTGMGIDPALVARLFEAGTQADHSLERAGGGLGLGLALVKGLVELHRGRVAAASAGPGQGSVFTFWLPLEGEPAPLTAQPAVPAPARKALRILMVEDNRDAAESLRLFLQLSGHEVAVAHTGPAGVEAARRFHPDVVLCDIGLPGMDGYGVAGALRHDHQTARTRLIALTGYGQEEDRRRAFAAGFDVHLTKPVDPADLQRVLTEAGAKK